MLMPMISGLASGLKCPLSSKVAYRLIGLPFSSTLVRALPHFLGYDFSPLMIMPPSLTYRPMEGLRSTLPLPGFS